MGMELPYGPESKPPKRPIEQIQHEQTLSGLREDYDPGFHSENLYDQNEGAGGELLDLKTGRPIDNSTQTDTALVERDDAPFITSESGEPPLPPLEEENDEAARFLAKHDRNKDADQQEAA